MNKSNRVTTIIKQYKTRQQLHQLPDYLVKDIGKTQQEVWSELQKNSLLAVIASKLKILIKGSRD